jgi:hypothetical protein
VNLLNEAFNPKRFGVLEVLNGAGGRRIRAKPLTTPAITEEPAGTMFVRFEIEFETEAAYWESSRLEMADMGAKTALFQFPFSFLVEFGRYSQFTRVFNPSSVEAETVVEIYTVSQSVYVENRSTGEKLQVNHAVGANQKMTIASKDFEVKLFEKDENGAYQFLRDVTYWLTPESDALRLRTGENLLRVGNETQDDALAARLFWRRPVMGL